MLPEFLPPSFLKYNSEPLVLSSKKRLSHFRDFPASFSSQPVRVGGLPSFCFGLFYGV
jgi:hypothetical protein